MSETHNAMLSVLIITAGLLLFEAIPRIRKLGDRAVRRLIRRKVITLEPPSFSGCTCLRCGRPAEPSEDITTRVFTVDGEPIYLRRMAFCAAHEKAWLARKDALADEFESAVVG